MIRWPSARDSSSTAKYFDTRKAFQHVVNNLACSVAAPRTDYFLGVAQSATGRAWRDRLDDRGRALAAAIAQRYGLPDLLARIIAGRGIALDEVEAFLDPSLKRLMPDPDVLTDMAAAAARLADAVVRGETVAIFGDYDVDGATSSALLARFLQRLRPRRRSSIFPTASSRAMARTSTRSARWPSAARRCW